MRVYRISAYHGRIDITLCLFSLLFGFWAEITPAQAQSYSAYKQEVMSLYREGLALMRRKQYDRAILKHESALRLVHKMLKRTSDTGARSRLRTAKSNFSFLLGRCYQQKGRWVEAYQFYQQALRNEPRARVEQATRKYIKELWSRIKARLRVQGTPAQARVWVVDANGEKFYKRPPFVLELPPGKTKILVSAPGYQRRYKEIELRPRDSQIELFSLQRRGLRVFEISVTSKPQGARLVLVDARGRRWQGQTPWRGMVPAGMAALQLSKPGRRAIKRTISISSNSNRQFSYQLPSTQKTLPAPPRSRSTAQIVGWTGVALAIAGAGTGATLLLLANNETNTYNQKLGDKNFTSEEVNGHLERGRSLNTAGIVTFVVTGVVAGVAIGLLVWDSQRTKRLAASLPPQGRTPRADVKGGGERAFRVLLVE